MRYAGGTERDRSGKNEGGEKIELEKAKSLCVLNFALVLVQLIS